MVSSPQHAPLARHLVLDTHSPEEARDVVGRIFCPHFLMPRDRRPIGFRARHSTALQAGYSVNHVAYGADVDIDPGELTRFFLIQIPIAGSAEVTCGRVSVDVAADRTASILSPTVSTRMRWGEGCEKIIVLIERERVEAHHHALTGHFGPVEFHPSLDLTRGAGRAIARHIGLMVDSAEDDAGSPRAYQAGLREALTGLLLEGHLHNGINAMTVPVPAAAPCAVRRAEAYALAHLGEALSMADIAAAAGVGLRTLQDTFKRQHGQTLTEWIQTQRLEQFRQSLMRAHEGALVTQLAYEAGLGHLGRAAQAYRQKYGETPSETLKRRG